MSKNVWYPLSRPDEGKLHIASASSIHLFDSRGKRYLDANSGLWNVPLGYDNGPVKEAIANQLDRFCYINPCEFESDASEEFGDELKSILHPGIDKIVYTCSGSECLELMIKLIRKYASFSENPGRNAIAVVRNSYHGSYYGSMSLSSYDGGERNGYGQLLEGIYELSLPFNADCRQKEYPADAEEEMKKTLKRELEIFGVNLAGIILEPILGSAGVIPLPDWYVQEIKSYADEHGILIGFDEVATGFGRSGEMFCYEKLGIEPDLISMSKGINNGALPLGAVGVSKRITDRFRENDGMIFHLSTQNANALSCAAGISVVRQLKANDRELLKTAGAAGDLFENRFRNEIMSGFGQIFDLRREGMMFAVELRDKNGRDILPFDKLYKLVFLIRRNGIITEWSCIDTVSSCLVMFLPFVITADDIEELIIGLKNSFERMIV